MNNKKWRPITDPNYAGSKVSLSMYGNKIRYDVWCKELIEEILSKDDTIEIRIGETDKMKHHGYKHRRYPAKLIFVERREDWSEFLKI